MVAKVAIILRICLILPTDLIRFSKTELIIDSNKSAL